MAIFFVILFVLVIGPSNSNRQIFIRPQLSSECPSSHCPTINDVVEHYEDYFTSKTTLHFLSGNHTITNQSSIAVTDVEYLTLVGSEDSVVQCSGEFSFIIFNATYLQIENLEFYECGANFPDTEFSKFLEFADKIESWYYERDWEFRNPYPYASVLFLLDIDILVLRNIVMEHSGGIYCLNVFGDSQISDSSFFWSALKLVYTDVFVSNSYRTPVISFQLSNLHLNSYLYTPYNWCEYKPLKFYGLETFMESKSYAVTINLDNVTSIGQRTLITFTVYDHCSRFMLNASKLVLTKSFGVVVTIGRESRLCSSNTHSENVSFNTTVSFEKIVMSEIYGGFAIWGPLMATIAECTLYNNSCADFFVSDSTINISNMKYMENEGGIVFFYSNTTWCNTSFVNNDAKNAGGLLNFHNCNVSFHGSTLFYQNNGAFASMDVEESIVNFIGNTNFTGNNASRSSGAIVTTKSSILKFHGNVSFIQNRGYSGGAITLHDNSYFALYPSTLLLFKHNFAKNKGGAIFYQNRENYFIPPSGRNQDTYIANVLSAEIVDFNLLCFFTIIDFNNTNNASVAVIFENNMAEIAGMDIYGGSIDTCWLRRDATIYVTPVFEPARAYVITNIACDYGYRFFKNIFTFTSNRTDLVTSDPTRICLCNELKPNCSKVEHDIKIFPGESFSIFLTAVGQDQGTVPATVYAQLDDNQMFSAIPTPQKAQLTNGTCALISYTVFAESKQILLVLSTKPRYPTFSSEWINSVVQDYKSLDSKPLIAGFCSKEIDFFLTLPVHINISFHLCPLGFELLQGACICTKVLKKHNLSCDIASQTIHKISKTMWIGTVKDLKDSQVIIVHNYCPFDYCDQTVTAINLEKQDDQCALNHSGTLCGKCIGNMSNTLGTSKCELCDNTMLVLLPVFMICGVVLVIFLIHLNLTVSVGTVNGLIFYANIIQVNRAAFFPSTQSFLSIFIAWLNLDFGVETCFYNGLDTYTKTWLQFVFPLYIWLLVIVMIVWSHYSITGTKLVGNNAVFVLATLFLISYAKLVRNIVAALSFTVLQLPNSTRVVWLYDANIEYFSAKHAPLFVVAVGVLLFISVPYTALLVFVQCFLSVSYKRMFRWVQRIMPLLDAYTGPYKDKHRHWTGSMLLVRVILFLIFSANVFGNVETNLLATIVTSLCIVCFNVYIHGPYKSISLTMLETFFLFNLIIICSTRIYPFNAHAHNVATDFLVSTVFATFCGIIIYHTYLAIKSLRRGEVLIQTVIVWCRTKKDSVTQKLTPRHVQKRASENNDLRDEQTAGDQLHKQPTVTTYDIREPLIRSTSLEDTL